MEDKDLEIVKTDGKAVPDIRKKGGEENVFPRFETFRENMEGHYWFPTYTRSNDILRFSSGDIPIRMIVKYENYKRFGVTVKIGRGQGDADAFTGPKEVIRRRVPIRRSETAL